jgi:threonine dehydratase
MAARFSGRRVTEPGAVATGSLLSTWEEAQKQSANDWRVECWHPLATARGSVTASLTRSRPRPDSRERKTYHAMLTLQLIKEAANRINGRVHRTPVITSRSFNEATGCEVFFKCENLQRAGAFKARGATNKILSLTGAEKRRGVIAVSSGNHAQAVALAAREAGIRAVVAIPADAPKMKVAATREYGAEIRFFDRQRDDREAFARDIAEREDLIMVPPYDDYLIMAGQGTCGLELLEDVPDLDCVLTPCSGGGLFAGVSTAAKSIKPSIRCFAVEPETANDTQQSIRKGERVTIPPPPTIADGLRVQAPGVLTFPITRANADDVLTVADEEMIAAMRFMLFRMKLLVEPSGAAAAAAVLAGKIPSDCRRVGVVLSGGNIDSELLSELLKGNEEHK